MIDREIALKKYREQRAQAIHRKDALGNDIKWNLSFEDWVDIWDKSGVFHLRGRKKNQYVMSRINDIGDYSIGNVIIQLASENVRQQSSKPNKAKGRRLGISTGPMDPETKQKISLATKGRTPWNKGKKGSQVAWNKGKKMSNVHWNLGRTTSEETKEKIRQGVLRRLTDKGDLQCV